MIPVGEYYVAPQHVGFLGPLFRGKEEDGSDIWCFIASINGGTITFTFVERDDAVNAHRALLAATRSGCAAVPRRDAVR